MGEIGELYNEIRQEAKARRADRCRKFKDEMVPKLWRSREVIEVVEKPGVFEVRTQTKGVVDVYPGKGRLRIRNQGNKWVRPMDGWLKKHLLSDV